MELPESENDVLKNAFPSKLTSDVSLLATLLDPKSGLDAREPFMLSCDGEIIQIPYRIYRPVISESQFASLLRTEQIITACWFTRHHNGYVRERFLRAIPAFDSPWVIAYVMALCGEYVVQLLAYIWQHRMLFDAPLLGQWLRDNQEFYLRTRYRIASYWDCYYRWSFPRFDDYVGSQLIAFFDESLTLEHPH